MSERAPSRIASATLVAASVGAWLLPGTRVGIGLVLVAVAIAAAIAWATRGSGTALEIVYGTLAMALVSTSVLRAAPWIIALNLLAVGVLATIAVTGARSWALSLTAPFAVMARFLQVPRVLVSPAVRYLGDRDLSHLAPAMRGTVVGSVLLVVFGGLFASADAAFARIAGDVLVPNWDISLLPYRVTVFFGIALLSGALILTKTAPAIYAPESEPPSSGALWSSPIDRAPRRASVVEWGIPIMVLDLLFASFVAVQVAVLFGGRRHVLVTEGLTYAEYARQGFFQLLAVAALVLLIVAVVVQVGRPGNRTERITMQALLGVLCCLTLVVLASALVRLQLYEETYGLTRLRVSVHGTIYWLAGVFGIVLVAGALWKSALLARTIIAFSATALIAFTLANPDALIARRNVDRFADSGRVDLGYLATLSEDAVPALAQLPPVARDCVLSLLALRQETRSPDPWNGFNVSRAHARELLEDLRLPLPVDEVGERCTAAHSFRN